MPTKRKFFISFFLILGISFLPGGIQLAQWLESALEGDPTYTSSYRLTQATKGLRLSQEQVATPLAPLGKKFFFDTRFSSNRVVSCASCHQPEKSFTDGLAKSFGQTQVAKNASTLLGLNEQRFFFWDGRSPHLFLQILEPLQHPAEHNLGLIELADLLTQHYSTELANLGLPPLIINPLNQRMPHTLKNDLTNESEFSPTDKAAFIVLRTLPLSASKNIIHAEGKSPTHRMQEILAIDLREKQKTQDQNFTPLLNLPENEQAKVFLAASVFSLAIADYIKSIRTQDAPFDRFLDRLAKTQKTEAALAPDFGAKELAGLNIFLGKGQCISCHSGSLQTDGNFHNTGAHDATAHWLSQTGRLSGLIAAKIACRKYVALINKSEAIIPRVKTPELKNTIQTLFTEVKKTCKNQDEFDDENIEIVGGIKTPTLRNLLSTSPYMDEGQMSDLDEVVEFYNDLGITPLIGHREETLIPLGLSKKQKENLKDFLKSLQSETIQDVDQVYPLTR